MNRSLAAFLIALLFHILIILLFLILLFFIPSHLLPIKSKQEHKIQISLKNYHFKKYIKKKTFGRKKFTKPTLQAPPMPKGSQLKKIIKHKYARPIVHKKVIVHKKNIVHKKIVTPKKIHILKKTITSPIVIHKPVKSKHILHLSSKPIHKVISHETNTSQHAKLFAFLSTPAKIEQQSSIKKQNNQPNSQIQQNIKKLYGETFGKLSPGEQKYILNNTEIMRRITQQILNRVGSVNIPNNLHVTSYNIVQFYLHPNGDMTGFKFLHKSNYYVLDETTKETIEYAYSKYPLPKQTTLIRYKVNFFLQGQQ